MHLLEKVFFFDGPSVFQRSLLLNEADFLFFYGITKGFYSYLIYKRDEDRFKKRGRRNFLSSEIEILIFLFYIRTYPTQRSLAIIFGCDRFVIHKTIKKIRKFIFDLVENSNSTISMGRYSERMEESCMLHGGIFTCAIDGTEQEVCSPRSSSDDVNRFYSSKKNNIQSTFLSYVHLALVKFTG